MSGHNLKPGDEVAIRHNNRSVPTLYRVEKITPSGRIKLRGRYTLNPDLSIRGFDAWGPFEAELVTDAIRGEIEKENLVWTFRHTDFRSQSLPALRAMVAAIKEVGDE